MMKFSVGIRLPAESILGGGSVGNSQILYQILSLLSDRAAPLVSTQIIRGGLPFAVQGSVTAGACW